MDRRRPTQQEVLDGLVHQHARVSGDAFPIDAHSWGIHGFIAVDGDVIIAAFGSREEARDAINRLWEAECAPRRVEAVAQRGEPAGQPN